MVRDAGCANAPTVRSRYRGCLIGGAVGDALGAPVEFMRDDEIRARFGPGGIRDFVPAYGRVGAITDDTQMTLFTAEGMLRAHVRANLRGIGPAFDAVTSAAYQRWLVTQGYESHLPRALDMPGWLMGHRELFSRRAPGNTCIAALRAARAFGEPATNDSKGCGGVMRVAPIGMYCAHWLRDVAAGSEAFDETIGELFDLGARNATLTHGHRSGQLPAGAFAVIVALLLVGVSLPDAVDRAIAELRGRRKGDEVRGGARDEGRDDAHDNLSDETPRALERARDLAARRPASRAAIRELGEGWVAEEALAIAVYCALSLPDCEEAVVLAVNHSGDSDSTGSITGNLLGAALGEERIPRRWIGALELREVIEAMADDLSAVPGWELDSRGAPESDPWSERYPGC